jgi:multidrug resistance protein MdtO
MAASISQPSQEPMQQPSVWSWFPEFLRRELAPYPGRATSVARMVVSATLIMFVVMTFQIPGAALAGYYALLISRENLWATWRAVLGFLLAFFAGSIYTFLGIILFIDYPFTHFLWVIVSLYIIFFVMGSALDYGAAAGFSFLIATAIPLWDRPGQLEPKVDLTLWTFGVVALGGGITFLVELIYHSLNRTDTVVEGVVARLVTVAEALDELSAGKEP